VRAQLGFSDLYIKHLNASIANYILWLFRLVGRPLSVCLSFVHPVTPTGFRVTRYIWKYWRDFDENWQKYSS